MRYPTPRHLSNRPPRDRGALIGQLLLIAVTIVIGGLLAMAFTRHGDPAESDAAAPAEATTGAPPNQPPPTASTPAATPAPGEPTPSSPSSGSSAVGGGNLLVGNPGFEDGLNGWRATGGGKVELVSEAHEGQQAVSLSAASGRQPGMIARQVTRCQPHSSYMAAAWVRTSQPGATVELNLIEFVGDRRLVTDVAGHVLPGGGWQRIEVDHVAHRPGAELAVEVVADGLTPQAELLVDDVEVRLAGKADTFTPRTTR
jgi:Carbohydrate binding domain